MKKSMYEKLQSLIIPSNAFVAGESRNRNFGGALEHLFHQCVDPESSQAFSDLEDALAMYGASSSDVDNKWLEETLARVIPQLEKLINEYLQ